MFSPKLKKEIMEVVDNQLRENDPPCTNRTFQIFKNRDAHNSIQCKQINI